MKTPDTTQNEAIGLILALVTSILVFVVPDATDAQKTAISGGVVAAATLAFMISDAIKRHGRATGLGPNRRS